MLTLFFSVSRVLQLPPRLITVTALYSNKYGIYTEPKWSTVSCNGAQQVQEG